MNDTTKRALHTFYQAAIPVFLAGISNIFNAFQSGGLAAGKAALLALATGAVAAGISALKSLIVSKPTYQV